MHAISLKNAMIKHKKKKKMERKLNLNFWKNLIKFPQIIFYTFYEIDSYFQHQNVNVVQNIQFPF